MKFVYVLKVSLWVWLVAAMILVLLLTSCNPYTGIAPTAIVSTETPASAEPTKSVQRSSPSPAPRTCTVQTGIPQGALNIRTGAGIDHSVIQTLTEGQRLTLTSEAARGHWIQVTTSQNVTGWVNSNYCTIGD